MSDTTITLTQEGKTYERQWAKPNECDGCAFLSEPLSHPACEMKEHLCKGKGFIWIERPQQESPLDMPGIKAQKAYNGCCGQPNTCEQPCFHASGRTTPGQPGGIASVPQSLEEVRYAADVRSDGWVTWDGGVMPVTGMVEVLFRNGATNIDDADSFLWDHRDCADDIVAYRNGVPAPQYDPRDVSFNPLDRQVGGSHYRDMAIQPVEFIVANNIPYREANVIKYVVRHASKNGKQDLLKARHYIDMLIADYEDAE